MFKRETPISPSVSVPNISVCSSLSKSDNFNNSCCVVDSKMKSPSSVAYTLPKQELHTGKSSLNFNYLLFLFTFELFTFNFYIFLFNWIRVLYLFLFSTYFARFYLKRIILLMQLKKEHLTAGKNLFHRLVYGCTQCTNNFLLKSMTPVASTIFTSKFFHLSKCFLPSWFKMWFIWFKIMPSCFVICIKLLYSIIFSIFLFYKQFELLA